MKLETKQTKVHQLEYTDWISDSKVYLTLTEWSNGEGFDVDIDGKGTHKQFSLHESEMNALLVLWGKANMNEPEESDGDE